MKTKKFSLKRYGFLLGIVLCAIVLVFMGSKLYAQQISDAGKTVKSAVMTDVLAKVNELEKKLEIVNQRLIIIETKMNERFSKLDARLDKKWIGLDSNLIDTLTRMETKLNNLDKDMGKVLKNVK